jgi:hypothetical protein
LLRTDVPKDELQPFNAPEPGVKYVDAATEEYARISGDVLGELITRALETGRR